MGSWCVGSCCLREFVCLRWGARVFSDSSRVASKLVHAPGAHYVQPQTSRGLLVFTAHSPFVLLATSTLYGFWTLYYRPSCFLFARSMFAPFSCFLYPCSPSSAATNRCVHCKGGLLEYWISEDNSVDPNQKEGSVR